MENPFKNRIASVNQLYAESPENAVEDYQYASEFIYSYRGSPDTFNTYRREIEHFLHWCWVVKRQSITSIDRNHIE